MHSPKQLPEKWIQKLFANLQGNYGSRFVDMWRSGQTLSDGTDTGIKNAMAHWSEKLAGFADQPERIRKALTALPPYPPPLPEFVSLCRQQQPDSVVPDRRNTASLTDTEQTEKRLAHLNRQFAERTASATNQLGWAQQPPSPGLRGPWARAIVDCAKRCDARFISILTQHVSDGTISGQNAQSALIPPAPETAPENRRQRQTGAGNESARTT